MTFVKITQGFSQNNSTKIEITQDSGESIRSICQKTCEKRSLRPSVEVALASTQIVIGYLMASVFPGQGSNIQVHGMKCNHELKEWMGSSLCGTVNRKQETGS